LKCHIHIYNDPRVQSTAIPGADTTSCRFALSYLLVITINLYSDLMEVWWS